MNNEINIAEYIDWDQLWTDCKDNVYDDEFEEFMLKQPVLCADECEIGKLGSFMFVLYDTNGCDQGDPNYTETCCRVMCTPDFQSCNVFFK